MRASSDASNTPSCRIGDGLVDIVERGFAQLTKPSDQLVTWVTTICSGPAFDAELNRVWEAWALDAVCTRNIPNRNIARKKQTWVLAKLRRSRMAASTHGARDAATIADGRDCVTLDANAGEVPVTFV